MSTVIPNEESWIAFLAGTGANKFGLVVTNGTVAAPTAAQIGAATDLTDFIVSLNASSSGNSVPTPRLKRKFETSVSGTVTATFSVDMYRDDENDLGWTTVPRGRTGCFFVKRFGGTGTANRPVAGQTVEVWPVEVTSRASGALSSGTAQTFTCSCSVPVEPNEDAVVLA